MRQNIKQRIDNWSFSSIGQQDENFNTAVWRKRRNKISADNVFVHIYVCSPTWTNLCTRSGLCFVQMARNYDNFPGEKVR